MRVLDSKLSGRDVVACLLNVTQKLKFTARPPRRIELVASIRLWPGDGPPPDAPEATPNADEAPFDALRTTSLIAHESTAIAQCYEQALARDPTLWGRLALTVILESDGTVHRIEEAESRFPDALVTRCAQAVIARLVFPAVLSKPFVFVQAIRFGAPPTSPASDSDAGQNALLVSPPDVAR
ncbi:MAG TPA: AgmX/PglI C-terminal domain-containing protein [Polyangiaceae bacterium]